MVFRKKNILLALSLSAITLNISSTGWAFNYGEALQKAIFFYDVQRLGKLSDHTGDLANRVYWRGDALLQDYALANEEGSIDLGGGFADAGDNPKFNFPMSSSMTMLAWSIIEFRDSFETTSQLKPMLANLKWGTDYLLKCWDPANKRLYGQVSPNSVGAAHSNLWMPYEVLDQASIDKNLPRYAFYVDVEHPGTDLAAEAVAALTAASLAFQASDSAYATKLLDAAKSIYVNLVDVPNKGKYSDNMGRRANGGWLKADISQFYNSWSGYNDEISWAAMWLYRATQDPAYLATAKQFILFGNLPATQSWDDKSYGSYLLMAKFLPDTDAAKTTARASAEGWLNAWANGTNGHTFSRQGLAIATALAPWGNARYAASTAFTALIYDKYFDSTKYHAFAKSQIDYLLGNNSNRFSYEIGFGTNYPTQPHHATAQGRWSGNNDVNHPDPNRHILYGALVGGPKDTNDTYTDARNDYIGNEVALDYNAGFVGALAGLHSQYGGDPLPAAQFPPTRATENPPADEIFVNGAIQSAQTNSNNATIQVSLLATNHSAWPARVTKNLKLKYFVNLSDKPANGSVTARTFSTDPRAVISDLKPYDASNQIYYVEVWFKDIPIYPGGDERAISSKETQLQFSFSWPHDYTKDWSYQGLGAQNSYKVSPNVPIYEMLSSGEKHLFGAEPGNVPQGTLTVNFASSIPNACRGARDTINIGTGTAATFTIDSAPFLYSMPPGGPHNVNLISTNNPIAVVGGSCKGSLNVSSVQIPGAVTANYTFTETPVAATGTVKIAAATGSDPKCSGASDRLFLDTDALGEVFTVGTDGISKVVEVGSHQVRLASQTSIPAPNNQSGFCKSTIDQASVTVTKDQTSLVNANYIFHPNETGMSCTVTSSKVTQQGNWGPSVGVVNTFDVRVNLNNFPKDPNGRTLIDGTVTMKNKFIQSFWSNFSMTQSINDKVGTFKGEVWSGQIPFMLGGFVGNQIPLKVGDNPIESITVNGVTCAYTMNIH